MNMTRRAFFMRPTRPVGEHMEGVGEWLLRERSRGTVPMSGRETENSNEKMIPDIARGEGLRTARANIRSNEHE
jgi:hypothetical protein